MSPGPRSWKASCSSRREMSAASARCIVSVLLVSRLTESNVDNSPGKDTNVPRVLGSRARLRRIPAARNLPFSVPDMSSAHNNCKAEVEPETSNVQRLLKVIFDSAASADSLERTLGPSSRSSNPATMPSIWQIAVRESSERQTI